MTSVVLPCRDSAVLRAERAASQIDPSAVKGKALVKECGWSPYQDNGGSSLCIVGADFALIAADTRMSNGYQIMDRNTTKCAELGSNCVLASSGMMADRNHLHSSLGNRLQWYEYRNKKVASTGAISRMVTNALYGRRFFPLYTYNVLVGLDEEGRGIGYRYDVVGCTEVVTCGATGSAAHLIEPILDAALKRSNIAGKGPWLDITQEEAIDLAKEAMTAAGEREIETGMSLVLIA